MMVACLPASKSVQSPAFALGDSHFSFQPHFELPAPVDRVELLHAPSHGDRAWRLVVAVPATQPGDDPSCPSEACDRVEVLLPFCLAFKRRAERFERFDLRLGEDDRCRQARRM